ncbi:hypothetical protein D3C87_280050 [compost metagenome]
MLTKLIDTSSYYSKDEPQVSIIDIGNTKGLLKQAADSAITEFASKLQPEKGKIYLHILAMGAGEYYGANRNADYFPEANLIDYHKTFETEPAHVFRNHVNKNPEIAIGKVIFSVYNERMHRVELIAEVWLDKAPDIEERIAAGDWPKTSMACKTPYDVCAICGNKASTRAQYCEHLSEELGRVYPDGRKVMALNVAPLRFFDISVVVRPADVTSAVLQKVAEETGQVVGSAELAEIEGLDKIASTEKTATLKKLSEFIKEIDGDGVGDVIGADENLDTLLNRVKDPDFSIIEILRNYKLNEVFSTMAHMGITPSLSFLAELISRKLLGKEGEGIGSLAASFVSSVGAHNAPMFERDFGEITHPNIGVATALMPYLPGASYLPEHVENRVSMTKAAFETGSYVRGTNVGYAGNGPHIEPTIYERFKEQSLAPHAENRAGLLKVLNTIVAIGGAALAAKWYITQAIEKKMKEAELNRLPDGVKIVLVKSSSDYKLTYKLAKAAMVRLIQKK